jgi:hypothetical protein
MAIVVAGSVAAWPQIRCTICFTTKFFKFNL